MKIVKMGTIWTCSIQVWDIHLQLVVKNQINRYINAYIINSIVTCLHIPLNTCIQLIDVEALQFAV